MAKIGKLASNPPTGGMKQGKVPVKLAAKPPTQAGHQGATRVGRMELHHTPSGHAQRILKGAVSGSGKLVGPQDNFGTPAARG
jgi:hypothetical protein